MCFFDQHRFSCGDYKWGHFRQHCNREHRTGETCGMKLIMSTIPVNTRCKLCEKIDTKRRRRQRELDRINGWREASRAIVSQASRQKAQLLIERLDRGIEVDQSLRERRYRSCASEVGPAIPSIGGTRNTLADGSTIYDDAMPGRVSLYLCSLYRPTTKYLHRPLILYLTSYRRESFPAIIKLAGRTKRSMYRNPAKAHLVHPAALATCLQGTSRETTKGKESLRSPWSLLNVSN